MNIASAPRVTLLDAFTLNLRGRGATADDLPRRVQRLIAHLGLAGRLSRTAVAGQLWPDVPESHAQGSLRSALWRLHQVAPGLIEASGGSLYLAANVCVDVRELDDWARQVVIPRTNADTLEMPDARLRGELLPGWYDDWVLLERERLRQLRMHSLEILAVKLAGTGRYGEALQAAHAAVRAEPLRESAHRVIVRVHLAEGNLVEALRAQDDFRTMLYDELGVVPTEQMTQLLRGIPRPRRSA